MPKRSASYHDKNISKLSGVQHDIMSKPSGMQDAKVKKIKIKNDLNLVLTSEEIKQKVAEAFSTLSEFIHEDMHFFTDPFPCCTIKNFLKNVDYVNELKNELLQLDFIPKSNDLYQFKQSRDLNNAKSKNIAILREQLFGLFRTWLKDVTKISLNNTVDMSCAIYENSDVLLCHDDELEGRRIAFVYYLVPQDWNANDGGSLDLFETNSNGEPSDIKRILVPSFNSLVFFEVTEKSFHQVSEVLSNSKSRLTVSGWFHGETQPRSNFTMQPTRTIYFPLDAEDDLLLEWINPIYLNTEIVDDIQEQFEEESEIQLKDFLLNEKYIKLEEILSQTKFSRKFIANQRLTYDFEEDNVDTFLAQFLTLLRSRPFYKLLTKLTGIELVDLENVEPNHDETHGTESFSKSNKSTSSSCVTNVRKWQHGCYTLVSDFDPCGKEFAMDLILSFSCDDWNALMCGGFVSYIARDEDEELLSVHPVSNCLSLVYRDDETMRFHKYINNKVKEQTRHEYFEISAIYFEGKN
uniref:uS12 prolyl 3-hydroxylase n=1 Tax=Hydra vulgaris TaxID=6087 RepID=T2M9H1_HYDVU